MVRLSRFSGSLASRGEPALGKITSGFAVIEELADGSTAS
jgi:hypothetical protein